MENTLPLTSARKAHRLAWEKHMVVTPQADWPQGRPGTRSRPASSA
ncbi:hypothetical protein F444_17787 [Phytophthora nicotianae P1976]|uniref:Uncharacterized protein n=1 Tax=Phytophthora nicotianae P1976 TaxID=1317066 RepID=A0A080ZDT2_PHYNI|nr:hypothetical protein F444_17787 [Phytophthora nicotianae P1976]